MFKNFWPQNNLIQRPYGQSPKRKVNDWVPFWMLLSSRNNSWQLIKYGNKASTDFKLFFVKLIEFANAKISLKLFVVFIFERYFFAPTSTLEIQCKTSKSKWGSDIQCFGNFFIVITQLFRREIQKQCGSITDYRWQEKQLLKKICNSSLWLQA